MNTTNDKRPRMPVGDTRRALPLLAVLLFAPTQWFARLKARRRDIRWLKYL